MVVAQHNALYYRKENYLGEGIFEGGDRSEDFGHADKDIRSRDNPDVDWSWPWVTISIDTCGGLVVVARGFLVEEFLEDSSVKHG